MEILNLFLIFLFLLSILLSYTSLSYKKSSMEIVNEMGMGYNLGNIFDCYDKNVEIKNPFDQITLCGNSFPTKQMISSIKKSGFKTIRFPVTWINFIDDYGNINSDWLKNVKEVIDLIINSKMYCILNLENDGKDGNWLSKGILFKDKYTNLWRQIANEFKDYDEHLIFESMDVFESKISYSSYEYEEYNYTSLLILIQSFIDIIRNSGGNNIHRLLIISGANADITLTCNLSYKIPIDISNKLAVSIHYYIPYTFTLQDDYFFTLMDFNGEEYNVSSDRDWGNDINYNQIITNFDLLKFYFLDKGIPVIITEVGVITEQQKKIESIREFLYVVFAMSSNYNGIVACLWDTSNKTLGNMNYYNRELNEWYDEKIRDNFKLISRGKYIKPLEYFFMTNSITTYVEEDGYAMYVEIGSKRALKVIFNCKYDGKSENYNFYLETNDEYGELFEIKLKKNHKKKEYDGTYTFTVEVTDINCYDFIGLEKYIAFNSITFNYLRIEFEETFLYFDYISYKKEVFNNF